MRTTGHNRWRRGMLAGVLLLAGAGGAADPCLGCRILPRQACRFIESYRTAPQAGILGRLALSLMESSGRDSGKS